MEALSNLTRNVLKFVYVNVYNRYKEIVCLETSSRKIKETICVYVITHLRTCVILLLQIQGKPSILEALNSHTT